MHANPDVYRPFFFRDYKSRVAATEKNDDYYTELEVAALAKELGRDVRVWQGYPKASLAAVLRIALYNSKNAVVAPFSLTFPASRRVSEMASCPPLPRSYELVRADYLSSFPSTSSACNRYLNVTYLV